MPPTPIKKNVTKRGTIKVKSFLSGVATAEIPPSMFERLLYHSFPVKSILAEMYDTKII